MTLVSGKPREDVIGLTVRELVVREGHAAGRVAVELNERILDPSEFDTTIAQDDVVEIVEFMGGGR